MLDPNAAEGAGGTKKKKGGKAPAVFEVELDDTVLFPRGGGQPSDLGTLSTPDGKQHKVLHVYRDPSGIVKHQLKESIEADVG